MLPGADPVQLRAAVEEFLVTPVDWYMHLASRLVEHRRVSLSGIRVPASFVAGTWDVLASPKHMRTAAERFEASSYSELPASHFVPLEHPDAVHEQLLDLLGRVRSEA